MRIGTFFLSFAALLAAGSASTEELVGPDGRLRVSFELEAGRPYYAISYEGTVVLESSPLGLETSIGSFAEGLSRVGVDRRKIDQRYELRSGKVSQVRYQANEMTARLRNVNGDELEIVFRASDHDVAFAYRIASEDKQRVVIESEATGFDLPARATAFVTHQAKAGTGWMGTKPSYEEGYLMDAPISTPSPTGLGFTFPALFRLGEAGWALISETGTSSQYAGTRLSDPTEQGLYRIAFPEPDENGGRGEATVAGSLPLQTPWRTITFGKDLGPIVESTVATDVVEPLYEPTVDYRPGRASWSWLLWQDASMNETDQRAFVDLAAELEFEYILVDALWDSRLGRDGLVELVDYAQSKGVDVLLWYNSNGYWNDAPQGPRDRLVSAPVRQREMAWLQSIGVKGLKVDFFGGDKQTTLKLYEDILTDGNRFGLHMNFHGATLPRGWERMYPNFMTSEAVTASENLVFSQGFADSEAWRSTVISLIRNPVAAMDYGPMVLNQRFGRTSESGNLRRTTDAFQLATAALFFSPIQHYGVTPNNLDEQPEFVLDYLRELPAAWDEIRFVAGYPGDHVALARRKGDRWYVAVTNGQEAARTMELDLPFLAGERVSVIQDQAGTKAAALRRQAIAESGRIEVRLEGNGGAVLISNP